MTTEATQAQPDTSTQSTETTPITGGLGDGIPAKTETPAPTSGPLDFIPEQYRGEAWATKYKTADDFFKGFDNLTKLAGKKEVTEGLKLPGEEASPEEWEKFYQGLGRPESFDKYELPKDLEAPEGYDLDAAREHFSKFAHKNGLTQKQAQGMFKDFLEFEKENFAKAQTEAKLTFDKAVVKAFGEDYQKDLALAKKAAKALNIGTTLDEEGLSAHPVILKMAAELGKYVGEDTFVDPGNTESKESLKERTLRLQRSPLYQKGDPATLREVERNYKIMAGEI